MPPLNLKNLRFGQLTAKYIVGRQGKYKMVMWYCECDCGGNSIVRSGHLLSGRIVSCCHAGGIKHGQCRGVKNNRSAEYQSFHGAKARCQNVNHPRYSDWGGRGIEFRFESFDQFLRILGPKPNPKKKYSLDRYPNNDGHYEPNNVRWATAIQQQANTRVKKNHRKSLT